MLLKRHLLIIQTAVIIGLSLSSDSHAQGIADFSANGEPVTISADVLSFDPDTRLYTAEGNVEIAQGNRVLSADKASLNNETGDARAHGKVILMEDGDLLSCDSLEINMNSRIGTIKKGRLFLKKGNFHITGDEIEKTGDQDYSIKGATFTTCDGESPSWNFSASSARVTVGEYMNSWNNSYRIKGVPVFYLPYMILPVKQERQSGLLIPRIGISDVKGFEINNSFFWAISKSTDATISLNYMSLKGVEEGLEYRYVLSKNASGTIEGSYLKESDTNNERWMVRFKHDQYFSPTFYNKTNVNYISDTQYYRTYGYAVEERSQDRLESYVSFTKNWQNYSLVTQFKYYKELNNPQDTTLQKLPEILLTGLRHPIGSSPFYLTLNSSAVNYVREVGEKGQRVDINPRISMNISPGGIFTFTPELGLRETAYFTDGDQGQRTREMYDLKGSLTTTFLKVYSLQGEVLRKVRHSIEPEIVYEYIPNITQDSLPLFDPLDRIGKRNLVTYSLTNRLAGKIYSSETDYDVRELLLLRISQSYDINEANRELVSAEDRNRPLSDVTGQLRITPSRYITLISDAAVGAYDGYLKAFNSSAQLSDARGDSAALEYRYTKDALEYVRGQVTLKASKSLNISYDSRYSILENRYLENIYAVDYHPQCWSVQLTYSERPDERKYFAVFNLTGIGTVGRLQGATTY